MIGLRAKLLAPFLAVPLAAIAVSGCLTWWVSDWAAERSFDRVLGDKLELAVEVLKQLARERLDETRRLAESGIPGRAASAGLDMLGVKEPAAPLRIVDSTAPAAEGTVLVRQLELLPELTAGAGPRFALLATDGAFLAVAAAPLAGGDGFLVTGRRLTRDLLDRFTSLTGIEMGLFGGWQRAAVSSFGVDLERCQECHDATWRVGEIAGQFHRARSFKGHAYFATSLGDGFRYAFMPFELHGRRVAMIVVRQPLEALASARRQTLALLAGGGLLALGISLGAWWGLARHVTASITALQRWMESILEGRPLPLRHLEVRGEVDRLAQSLTTTMGALRDSRDHVERINGELLRMVDTQHSTISSMREGLGRFLDLAKAPERVPESDEVARQMLRHVCQLFGFARARMIVLDPADEGRAHCLELGAGGAVLASPFDAERDPVVLGAARRSPVPFHLDPSLAPPGVHGPVLVAPITVRGQPLGVLVLGELGRSDGAGPDLETLAALVHQGAMALEHGVLLGRAQETYLHTAGVLVTTIEAKDPYLRGHSDRVARMAVAVASRLGISNGPLRAFELCARFHDVGKICIDSSILLKPGRLSAEEFDAIKRHVEIGEAIVAQITSLRERAPVVGQHHERWDGRGYVRGIGGEDIRLEARIIAVADSFDAMTSARPYRPALDAGEAAREIARGSGAQFDPSVADIFADLVLGGPLDRHAAAAATVGAPS